MKGFWTLFENLNEFFYVADMDTHELVYMNKKLREACGVTDEEQYVGKMCYEMVQHCSEPCATCCGSDLREGYFKEWQSFNPLYNKYFVFKDTMILEDGRRYHISSTIDVSAQEKRVNMLQDYEDMEHFVNAGLRMAMNADTPDKSIEVALEYLGKALHGERTYVFEQNANGRDDNTYEWVASGVTPEKDNLQDLPAEVCAHWYEEFREDKIIVISDLEDIREEDPLQYENLKRQNIHSLVVVPLYDEGKAFGFYGVDNPPSGTLEYVSNLLQMMGFFFVAFIRRRNLVNRLRDMSVRDQLTQLGNRYAMVDYLKDLRNADSRGIVYCDVTGLKQVNDTLGHTEGDNLLLRATDSIKDIFEGYGLFRIGGDEFLILCRGISKEELEQKAAELRAHAKENDVVLAIGSAWAEGKMPGGAMHKMLVEAETLMYDDKAAYYEKMGIDRRRR